MRSAFRLLPLFLRRLIPSKIQTSADVVQNFCRRNRQGTVIDSVSPRFPKVKLFEPHLIICAETQPHSEAPSRPFTGLTNARPFAIPRALSSLTRYSGITLLRNPIPPCLHTQPGQASCIGGRNAHAIRIMRRRKPREVII